MTEVTEVTEVSVVWSMTTAAGLWTVAAVTVAVAAAAAAAAVEPPSLRRTSPSTRTEFCTRRQFFFAVASGDLLGDIIDAARESMV